MQNLEGLVVVTGIPGSGKTTLARSLAHLLGVSLISKDTIKEALFDALHTGDLEWSRKLGRASYVVMYALARDTRCAVLESFFWPGVAEDDLASLNRRLIQVYCDCPVDVAVHRYRVRAASASRHDGHLPEHQADEVIATWVNAPSIPLGLDAPLIRVATMAPVDMEALVVAVRSALTP